MWQPQAELSVLQQRATLLKKIRTFFESRKVLDVDVPVLGECGVTDPYIDAIAVEVLGKKHYLQTSPEYFMKRLLASGSGDIYYLGKAFRADEKGRLHNPEFTMLEWYRLDFDDQQLIKEVIALVQALDPEIAIEKKSYEEVFTQYVGVNPHSGTEKDLAHIAKSKLDISWSEGDKSSWLDLLFTHLVEPNLPEGLIAIYDYPACQCALAKVQKNDQGVQVARRFECFINGIELANGYWELCDLSEQKQRFHHDNQQRVALGKLAVPVDEALLSAIAYGLPNCAGVALGIDRLVMALLKQKDIKQQRSF